MGNLQRFGKMTGFYIYEHRKADSGELFYIGKGKGNRLTQTGKRNPHWKHVANKHGFVAKKIADGLTESEAFEREKQLIREMRMAGILLCNMTDGGDSGPSLPGELNPFFGKTHSPETINLIKEKLVTKALRGPAHPMYGKPRSTETKRKLSDKMRGRIVPAEVIARRTATRKKNGKPSGMKGKTPWNKGRVVPETEITGRKTYQGVFVSPTEESYRNVIGISAFARQHALDPSELVKLTRGKAKTHRGWRFIAEQQDVP